MAELRRRLCAAIPDMVDDGDISEGILSPLIRLMEGTSGATGGGTERVIESASSSDVEAPIRTERD